MDITYGSSIEITRLLDRESAERIAQWIGGYTVIAQFRTLPASALSFPALKSEVCRAA